MERDVIDKALQELNDIKVKPDNKFESCINCKFMRTWGKTRYGKYIITCTKDLSEEDRESWEKGRFIGTAWPNETYHRNTRYNLKTKRFNSNNYFNFRCESWEYSNIYEYWIR